MSTLTKGVIWKDIKDPAIPAGILKGWAREGLDDAAKAAFVEAHNARSAIVATCKCGKELVEEERRNHAMQCVEPEIRHLVRMLADTPPGLVKALMGKFSKDGELKVV